VRSEEIEVALVSSEMPPISPCIDNDTLGVKARHTDKDREAGLSFNRGTDHRPRFGDSMIVGGCNRDSVGPVGVIVYVVKSLERRGLVGGLLEFIFSGEIVVDDVNLGAGIKAGRNGGVPHADGGGHQ
jgi:hypothetical protein